MILYGEHPATSSSGSVTVPSTKKNWNVRGCWNSANTWPRLRPPRRYIWLTRLLSELDLGFGLPTKPVVIVVDNQGATTFTKYPRFHACTKYIDMQRTRWEPLEDRSCPFGVDTH